MGVGENCVGYISIAFIASFPMEKMHLQLGCVTVRPSHRENFEPICQYDSGMDVTNTLWSYMLCEERGVEKSESSP